MRRPSGMRARIHAHDDAGFTLVEALVSLMVLGIIFTALAAASLGSIRASMNSRAEQQAIDFATQALERTRQLDYYGVGHDATDVSADSAHVDPCGLTWCFDPGDGAEELVIMPGGSINPHVRTVSSAVNNGINFTVATYVTRPVSSGADVKRVTVVTRWSIGTKERERVTSSLVTATTRGLPVPLFNFETASNVQAVNPGTGVLGDPIPTVAFKIELTNQGAPDRWDLTTNTGTWTFWRDNGDNLLCTVADQCGPGVALDTLMVDTDDPGTNVDTGRLDPTTAMTFWAVRAVPETALGTYDTTLTASAVSLTHGGVDASAGVRTLSLRTIVTDEVITGLPGGGTPNTDVPSVPRDFTVTVQDGQLTAAWAAPEDAGTSAITDYLIQHRLNGAGSWTAESDISTNLSRVISGLTNDVLYEVRISAVNSSGPGPSTQVVQAQPTAGSPYVDPTFCPVTNPATLPVAVKSGGYSLWNYALHNRSSANGAWPGSAVPGPSYTDVQGLPLNMIKDYPEFAPGTNLPVYSADIVNERGRVIRDGGGLGTTDTENVIDWRTDVPGKRYSGTAVLTFWVAPSSLTTTTSYQLTAQLYTATATETTIATANTQGLTSNGNSPSSPASTADSPWCTGVEWQQVAIPLPIDMKKAMGGDEFLGVRLWNSGDSPVRIGYDVVGDFPAFLTVPEK